MINEDLKIFAERMQIAMTEKKMSAQDLADAIGVSFSTIYRYLRCEVVANIITLKRFAEVLECTTDFLLGLTRYED